MHSNIIPSLIIPIRTYKMLTSPILWSLILHLWLSVQLMIIPPNNCLVVYFINLSPFLQWLLTFWSESEYWVHYDWSLWPHRWSHSDWFFYKELTSLQNEFFATLLHDFFGASSLYLIKKMSCIIFYKVMASLLNEFFGVS